MLPTARRLAIAAALALAAGMAGCVYQPLYGTNSYAPGEAGYDLALISIPEADTRVGQQVRNNLIFLLQGGRAAPEPVYQLYLRSRFSNREFAATRYVQDVTAGTVTASVSYDLIEIATKQRVAGGNRVATASYDRTGQSFANVRALRDAENRAAREVAEMIRLALAAELSRR